MSSPTPPELLGAFIDGELDLTRHLELEQRLEREPALRRQADDLRQLRAVLREQADHHAAPDELRRRIAAPMAPAPAPRQRLRAAAWRRWFAWRPLAASFTCAAALAVFATLGLQRSAQSDRLLDDVVASHVRATVGEHLVDVASADHHKVKPFLSMRLGFSPPVDELQVPGSAFLGGRVDYLAGRPVAALVYKQGEHVVDSFVWPADTADTPLRLSTRRGFLVATWSHADMTHCVISDVNREEFQAVVAAIRAAEAH